MDNDKNLKITFCSGAGTVTGANFLLEGNEKKFLIDCGLIQGEKFVDDLNWAQFPYDASSIDILFITHGHIDHINGNKYVFDTYGLLPEVHQNDVYFIEKHLSSATMYGLPAQQSPMPETYLKEGDVIEFGNSKLQTIHTPGHSPGSITFYNVEQKFMIAGDVLFYGSIGRTDLYRGNHDELLHNISTKLFTLPPETEVYCGHGSPTQIGFEKQHNPFF